MPDAKRARAAHTSSGQAWLCYSITSAHDLVGRPPVARECEGGRTFAPVALPCSARHSPTRQRRVRVHTAAAHGHWGVALLVDAWVVVRVCDGGWMCVCVGWPQRAPGDVCATNPLSAAGRALSHADVCEFKHLLSALLRATSGTCPSIGAAHLRPSVQNLLQRASRAPAVHQCISLALRGAPLRPRVRPHARTHLVGCRPCIDLGARPFMGDGERSWSARAPV